VVKPKTPDQIYGETSGGGPSNLILEYFFEAKSDLKDFFGTGIRILDIGCGQGFACDILKNMFKEKIFLVACDVSEASIQKIKSKNCADDVFKCDVSTERIPYNENTFDIVLLFDILEHISNPYFAVNEAKRICKYGGKMFISIPDEKQQFGYRANNHAFVYPGLFKIENFVIFLKQMYLNIKLYKEFLNTKTHHIDYNNASNKVNPIHHAFLCENSPANYDILDVVNLNLTLEELCYPNNEI